MSTTTYGLAPDASETVRTSGAVKTVPRMGCFARLMEARRRQAFNELRRHGILLPHELEQAGWKITERSEDSLPFQR
jgi:hypothetical protein